MPDKTDPSVPDPATSYERAKPEQESPSGKLVEPPPPVDAKPDDTTANKSRVSPEDRG